MRIDRGIVVLNITQCEGGCVAMELYETGLGLQRIGVVSGRDMTTEAAVTKMMYLLGAGYTSEEVKRQLKKSLRGELTE